MIAPSDLTSRESSREQAPGGHFNWGAVWPAFLILLGLVFICYANSLRVPFVYDDMRRVVENGSIRDLSNLRYLFLYDVSRPLLNLTYALNFRVGGLNPLGYHLFNAGIHALNAFLIFLIVLFTLRGAEGGRLRVWLLAFLPAACFGVHPFFTEAVTYVSGRSSVLCAFFCLLSVGAFARFRAAEPGWRRGTGYALSLLFFLLALPVKEEAATLPALIGLYDYFFGSGPERFSRVRFRAHLPFWLVLLLGAVLRLGIYFRMEAEVSPGLFYSNFISQFKAAFIYLKLLVWPAGLSLIHDLPREESCWNLRVLGAAGVSGLLLALAYLSRKKYPLVSFAVTAFFILLSPYFFIPLSEVMAEHRAYLPGLCFCLLLGTGLAQLAFAFPRGRGAVLLLAAALLMGFLALTVARNRVWGNELLLWQETAAQSPHSWRAHYALGDEYLKRGNPGRAVDEYRTSLSIWPGHLDGWINLGVAYARQGMWAEAESAFRSALGKNPDYVKAFNNLGALASLQGKRQEAVQWFERSLGLEPENFNANLNLGDLWWSLDRERAVRHYRVALARAPLSFPRERITARLEHPGPEPPEK